jgi:predicted nucleic acid-binding protein
VIVLDASAAVDLLLGRPASASIAARIAREGGVILAPHLIDLEVAQVLRRFGSLGLLDEARAQVAFDDFAALGIQRYAHDVLVPRIWELRANATAYDAVYLALAEATNAPLVTTDAKLAAVPGARATVEVVK